MKHKKRIIRNELQNLLADNAVRMHMPGHKGKRPRYYFDITEIVGADNLHDSRGIIKEAQDKIADIYGAEESVILVGSTTAGLQASILSIAEEGDKVLIPVNAHRSVYPAFAFGRIEPLFYKPELLNPGMVVTLDTIKDQVEANPDLKAVLLVSPDFYGNISDFRDIADYLHEKDIALIVDQAHGAHLKFLDNDLDALTQGADYVVESTHKILGAPTQGSVLHMQGLANKKKAKKLLAMLESSSPSYMIMAGVEEAVDEAEDRAKTVFDRIYRAYDAMVEEQEETDPMQLLTFDSNYDKSKFVFSVPNALEVQKRLIEEFRIIPELAYGNIILCMTGIGTSQRDLNRLFGAVKHINRDLKEAGIGPAQEETTVNTILKPFTLGEKIYKVYSRSGEFLPVEEVEGMINTNFIVPYPPGIPILIPGSLITKEDIENIKTLVDRDYVINGLEKDEDGRALIEVIERT